VPNDQLSLAIGKNGINVRLSVKLTNWKLDILSDSDYEARAEEFGVQPKLSIVDKIRLGKEKDVVEAVNNTLPPDFEPDFGEEVKLSDLAREMGLKTADLLERANAFGLDLKSVRSKIGTRTAELLKEKIIL